MSPDSQKVVLTVNNLTKKYKDVLAVDKLTFKVYKGEILGFLGPNGAGKTTTINMVCGLLRPDDGDITMEGISLKTNPKEARSHIGMCPQSIVIWKDLTCMEQIIFMGEMYGISPEKSRKRGLELLETMGLQDRRDKLARTLSGGMQRRLNLILALVHDPAIVILDEPEAGLDPQSRILVRDYIISLARKKTIILTTHNMDEAERLADRVAVIDNGRLLVVDSPEVLKNKVCQGDILEISFKNCPTTANEVYQTFKGIYNSVSLQSDIIAISTPRLLENISDILSELKNIKIEPEDIRIRKRTLEDVFIALTGRGLRE